MALVALPLLLWGICFVAVGTWKALRPVHVEPNPYGNGTPAVLVVGGAALAVAGLTLAGVALVRARWFWRALEWLLFACAVLVLLLGVVKYDPKRAPWLVALAVFALALSGLVHQRHRFDIRPAEPGDPDKSAGCDPEDEERQQSL
ncbi:MAG: hypothetical protein P4L84_14605 [Isosphaeraceae bacterium]|nr:hypothetical protein [Isosphaeraceae bacterium]